ncbi:MAG: hypothetical protein ACK5Q5_10315 [Planctomycetaceae bacterium]
MSTALQRFAEWYLDLPPAGAGQGTSWRLDWGPTVGGEYSIRGLVLLAVVAAVVCVVVAVRESVTLPWSRRLQLLGLRLAVVALLLAMLGRLSVRVDRTEMPTVAVLIDTSASMGLVDQYLEPDLARSMRLLSASRDNRPSTRLKLVQTLTTRQHGRWLQEVERRHRVQLYTFDDHLHPLSALTTTSTASTATNTTTTATGNEQVALISGLEPVGQATSPASAVRELLSDLRGVSLAAVVIWTDGVASHDPDERLSQGAELARQQGVPLYPIRVGSQTPDRDLELFDLRCPEVANAGEPVTVSLRGRSFGLPGETTEVQLLANGEPLPLAAQALLLTDEPRGQTIELSFTPQSEGLYELEVIAVPLTGESNVDNNHLRQRMDVRVDPLRVLLVEGRPRWEYRALKPALERDDTIQLHTFLQSADLDYTVEDRTALRALPAVQSELNNYDVIIWGDVDLAQTGRDVPELLRQFVLEHGGGLMLIAGEQHNPLGYVGTALELLSPVSLVEASSVHSLASPVDRLRLQRTLEGESTAFLRLDDDPAADRAAWAAMPSAIDWWIQPQETKPGASVLATGAGGQATLRPPLIVSQRYGQGTVLYHGFDQQWTWRRRVEDRYFGRYWSQAVRAVATVRRRRDQSGRRLTTDRKVYAVGDEVELRLRGSDSDPSEMATSLSVSVDSQAGEHVQTTLAPSNEVPLLWTGTIRDLPPGDFRAAISGEGASPGPACLFRIEVPDRELRQRAAATDDLQLAAKLSHGEYHTFSQADRVPSQLPRGRSVQLTESEPIRLWNRWETLLLTIGLLSAEWLLRKRARLV